VVTWRKHREFFNIFNRVSFQNPQGRFSTSKFDEVTRAKPNRLMN